MLIVQETVNHKQYAFRQARSKQRKTW